MGMRRTHFFNAQPSPHRRKKDGSAGGMYGVVNREARTRLEVSRRETPLWENKDQ